MGEKFQTEATRIDSLCEGILNLFSFYTARMNVTVELACNVPSFLAEKSAI